MPGIRIVAVAVALAMACPIGAAAQSRHDGARVSPRDSAGIAAVLAELDAAWHDGDASRWVRHYAADARFVNVSGTMMTDTATLRARLDAIFHGMFQSSRHVGTLRSLRALGPDAVIADEDIEITGFRALPAGVQATAPGVLRTRMRHVLQRKGKRWVIVASQNTAVAATR